MEALVVPIHELPGRTRLRVQAARLSQVRAERLANELCALEGVTKVEVNRGTGGILIAHAPTLAASDLSARARAILAASRPHQESDEGSDDAPDDLPRVTGIARELHRLFVDLDRDLRDVTRGRLDLGTATTLTLLTAGALEIAVTQKVPVPPWFNLAWWSFRTFMTTIEERASSAQEASVGPAAEGAES